MANENDVNELSSEFVRIDRELDDVTQEYKKKLEETFSIVVCKIKDILISAHLKFDFSKNKENEILRYGSNLEVDFDFKNKFIEVKSKSQHGKFYINKLPKAKIIETSYIAPYVCKENSSEKLANEKKFKELKAKIEMSKKQIDFMKNSINEMSSTEYKIYNDQSYTLEQFVELLLKIAKSN